jgi:hypothetical protein
MPTPETGTEKSEPEPESKPAQSRLRRPPRVLLAVVLILFVMLGYSTVHRAAYSRTHRSDFTVYQAAARAIIDGTSIYDAKNIRGWYYMYLPAFAVAMLPFGLLSAGWGAGIWYVLSVLMLAHMIHVSVTIAKRFFPKTRLDDTWLYTLATLAIAWPAISGLARGQVSIVLAWLVTLSIWLMLERRNILAGLCLAGGIIIKIFPALLLAYFIWRKRWLTAGAAAVWLVLLVLGLPSLVFGAHENWRLLEHWVTRIAMPANLPDDAETNLRYDQMIDPRIARNQSVQAVTIRWLAGSDDESEIDEREPLARQVAMVINLLLAGASAVVLWRNAPANRPAGILQISLVLLLMLFLSPVSWVHNYVLVAMPLALAIAAAADPTAPAHGRPFQAAVAGYFFANITAELIEPLHVHGILLLATLGIWAAYVWFIWRSPHEAAPEPGSETFLQDPAPARR